MAYSCKFTTVDPGMNFINPNSMMDWSGILINIYRDVYGIVHFDPLRVLELGREFVKMLLFDIKHDWK